MITVSKCKDADDYTALSAAVHQVEKLGEKQRVARFTILCNLLEAGADPSVWDKRLFNFLQNNVYACAYKTADSRKSKQPIKPATERYTNFHEDVVKYLLTHASSLTLDNNGENAPADTPQQKTDRFIRDSLTTLGFIIRRSRSISAAVLELLSAPSYVKIFLE